MNIAKNKKLPIFSFIINTGYDSDKKYLKHWEAVYCDGLSICHYDPLALNQRITELKKIVAPYLASMFTHYLKFKYNMVKNQHSKWSHCGYYALRFILLMLSG